MTEISWWLVAIFALSGIPMALLSCLVGMRPRIEIPLWWVLYAVWIAVVLLIRPQAAFWTLLISSSVAGLLHGSTSAVLLDRYIRNNPWHADKMQGPKFQLGIQFIVMGVVIGTLFGGLIAAIAWGLSYLI